MRKLFKLFKDIFTSKKTYIAMTQATLFTIPPMMSVYFADKWNEPWLYLYGLLFGLGLIGTTIISYMDLTEKAIEQAKEHEELVTELLKCTKGTIKLLDNYNKNIQ